MLKDGTKYLALVKFTNNHQQWMIVHWGKACGFSDPHGTLDWTSNEFHLRDPEFVEFFELNHVINLAQKDKNEYTEN